MRAAAAARLAAAAADWAACRSFTPWPSCSVREILVDNASQALLPRLVPREWLRPANGRLEAAGRIGNEFAGPPLGGLPFGSAHAAPVVLDAVSFGAASSLVLSIRGGFRTRQDLGAMRMSLLADVGEGLRWLRGERALRTIAITVALFALAGSAWFSIFVL